MSGGIKPKYAHLYDYLVCPIDDAADQDIKQHFKAAIEFIDQALYSGISTNVVLVHCAAGISRSGAIVCAYLMWKQKWNFENAWQYGKNRRFKMYPNLGF